MAGKVNGCLPGQKKGGRKKGTPNKRTLILVEQLGSFDPIKEAIDAIKQAKKSFQRLNNSETFRHDAFVRAGYEFKQDPRPAYLKIITDTCMDMAGYVFPKRKAVDVTSNGETVGQDFASFVKILLEEKK